MESEQSIQMQEASRATESGPVRNIPERREKKRDGESAPCEEPAVERKRKQDRPHEEGLIRTPSPEYADAVQVVAAMGGTEEKGESRKVEGGGGSEGEKLHRITLSRDPSQIKLVSDLGIGVKVTGGVRCIKCGELHAVITDVHNNTPALYKGLNVVEWCGRILDGGSFEEVRSVLISTEERKEVELVVKECSGKAENEIETRLAPPTAGTVSSQDAAASEDPGGSSRNTPSTDRDESQTPHTSTPSPSPTHSRPDTPTTATNASIPSPTPQSPLTLRHTLPKSPQLDPRPASINLPAFRPQGDIVKPKFMLNDAPVTSPTQCTIVGPIRKYTIDSFQGGAPTATIELSLRYRAEDGHLRMLLHSVKPKMEGKANSHGSYFINMYLIPDDDRQGVRACEVLSHVSDLENPPCYSIPHSQLESVALRVILWEAKGKHPNFIGEVLLSLTDSDVVKLQGLPSWYPVCAPDPNLPALPSPVLVKKRKKEDLLHIVRTRTGQAFQTLRRPASVGIDILGLEGLRVSPSSSVENLKDEMKKINAANVTVPRRRVKKERRPVTELFSSEPSVVSGNGEREGRVKGQNGDLADSPVGGRDNELMQTSLSVPSSPLLTRRARSAGRDSSRRKKLTGIVNVLRGSLIPFDSVDLPHSPPTDLEDSDTDTSHYLSQSVDMRRRHVPISPLLTSASSSPSNSPAHKRVQNIASQTKSPERKPVEDRGQGNGRIVTGAIPRSADVSLPESEMSPSPVGSLTHTHGSVDGLMREGERATFAIFSDSSWYSAEEELNSEEVVGKGGSQVNGRGSPGRGEDVTESIFPSSFKRTFEAATARKRSRSADDLLDMSFESDTEEGGYPTPGYLATLHPQQLERDSSASSVEYATADSQPVSTYSSCNDVGQPGESSLDAGVRTQLAAQGIMHTHSAQPPISSAGQASIGGSDRDHHPIGVQRIMEEEVVAPPVSRWRSFDDLLGSLPIKKLRPRWLRRNRSQGLLSGPRASPQLCRTSSVPVKDLSIGDVKMELNLNPETSAIGVRLHEHTLSTGKGDLTVKTSLFSRVGGGSEDRQTNIISFKKTHYAGTLVASFQPTSDLRHLSLQVSLETGGRFFNRRSGHVVLELGSLHLSPSHPCNEWFPLYRTPQYPHSEHILQ